MVKIMVTGDNHIGLKYDKYTDVKNTLIEARFISLETLVKQANNEKCDLFIITGDLFDIQNVSKKNIKKVVEILSKFHNEVYVLPGNHDFYVKGNELWREFLDESNGKNITLLCEKTVYETAGGINIYPAFCDSKDSDTNSLGWIKESNIDIDKINIGVAHGTIEGVSDDREGKYFLMKKEELNSIPVDVWFIGHSHVTYPNKLRIDKKVDNEKIYNVGTHAQTDVANYTDGYGMIVELEKNNIKAKLVESGECFLKRIEIDDSINKGDRLLEEVESNLPKTNKDKTVIEIEYVGNIDQVNKVKLDEIYQKFKDEYLFFDYDSSKLKIDISKEVIEERFAENTYTALFLKELLDDSVEAQMAFDLFDVQKIKTERLKNNENKKY